MINNIDTMSRASVLGSKFFSLEKYTLRRALLSVFNKQDIGSLAKGLGEGVDYCLLEGHEKF